MGYKNIPTVITESDLLFVANQIKNVSRFTDSGCCQLFPASNAFTAFFYFALLCFDSVHIDISAETERENSRAASARTQFVFQMLS